MFFKINKKTARSGGVCARCGIFVERRLFRVYNNGIDMGKWCEPCRREFFYGIRKGKRGRRKKNARR